MTSTVEGQRHGRRVSSICQHAQGCYEAQLQATKTNVSSYIRSIDLQVNELATVYQLATFV